MSAADLLLGIVAQRELGARIEAARNAVEALRRAGQPKDDTRIDPHDVYRALSEHPTLDQEEQLLEALDQALAADEADRRAQRRLREVLGETCNRLGKRAMGC